MDSTKPHSWPEFSLLTEIEHLPAEAGYRMWQRKADGFRCYASHDRLVLRGRAAIKHRLALDDSPIPEGWLLDGELVVPSGDVGDVKTALAARRWDALRFEPFDVMLAANKDVRGAAYRKRWALLTERWSPDSLVAVHAEPLSKIPEVPLDWEGVVGKLPEEPWQPGRTLNAVKWKRSGVLTATIVGFLPGSGTWANTVGAVRFGLPDEAGRLVEVGTAGGLNNRDRRNFSTAPDDYIGRQCAIKHYGMNKRRLRNPIYLGLRDEHGGAA